MPGMLEAGIEQDLLVDRVGDDRGGEAGPATSPTARAIASITPSAAVRSGWPRFGKGFRFERDDRQRMRKDRCRIGGGNGLDRNVEAQPFRAVPKHVGIGKAVECRKRTLRATPSTPSA